MSEEELVKTAANKYGFNLEFKTKCIFEKIGCVTEANKLLRLNDDLLEIDLVATLYPDRPFIVECKGTDSSSFLILVRESTNVRSQTHIIRRHIISGTNYRLVGYDSSPQTFFCTFTGDFFSYHTKELKKLSKNDEENNFYKAQLQMINAISAFSNINTKAVSHIIPLIVTNAKIWVVDYNDSNSVSANSYKWVLHKVKLDAKLELDQRDEEDDVLSFVIPVVSSTYLEEFIKMSQNFNISTGCIHTSSTPI